MSKQTEVSMPQVEKNVPMPVMVKNKKYPWRELEVGDSFFVPVSVQTFASQASRAGQLLKGRKFSARKEKNGTRVWRVK